MLLLKACVTLVSIRDWLSQATAYRELGGFKDLPIMEDYELVSRLRKHGEPAIIPHAIQTSGRRWQTVGFLQTTLTNQVSIFINVVKDAP